MKHLTLLAYLHSLFFGLFSSVSAYGIYGGAAPKRVETAINALFADTAEAKKKLEEIEQPAKYLASDLYLYIQNHPEYAPAYTHELKQADTGSLSFEALEKYLAALNNPALFNYVFKANDGSRFLNSLYKIASTTKGPFAPFFYMKQTLDPAKLRDITTFMKQIIADMATCKNDPSWCNFSWCFDAILVSERKFVVYYSQEWKVFDGKYGAGYKVTNAIPKTDAPGFENACRQGPALSRMLMMYGIVTETEKKFPKTHPLTYVSLGSGKGFLQDFLTLKQLAKRGFNNLTVILIDHDITDKDADPLRKVLQPLFPTLQIRTFPSARDYINQTDTDPALKADIITMCDVGYDKQMYLFSLKDIETELYDPESKGTALRHGFLGFSYVARQTLKKMSEDASVLYILNFAEPQEKLGKDLLLDQIIITKDFFGIIDTLYEPSEPSSPHRRAGAPAPVTASSTVPVTAAEPSSPVRHRAEPPSPMHAAAPKPSAAAPEPAHHPRTSAPTTPAIESEHAMKDELLKYLAMDLDEYKQNTRVLHEVGDRFGALLEFDIKKALDNAYHASFIEKLVSEQEKFTQARSKAIKSNSITPLESYKAQLTW